MSKTPEYGVWKGIKRRCYVTTDQDYHLYGGKGVVVCDRWLHSFPTFLEDMGARPSKAHSIEREDSNGDYEPSNCRWATPTEQARNTSRNVRYEYRGRSQTVKEWCDELDLPYYSVKSRLADGWPVAKAFETPVKKIRAGELIEHQGKAMTMSDWSRHLGLGLTTLCYRLRGGWPLEIALTPVKLR